MREKPSYDDVLPGCNDGAHKVVCEVRARIRNKFRSLMETFEVLQDMGISDLYVRPVTGADIDFEDRMQAWRWTQMESHDDPYGEGIVASNMRDKSCDESFLRRHEYIRYLRDKFRLFITYRQYDKAVTFFTEAREALRDQAERREFFALVRSALAEIVTVDINSGYLSHCMEVFESTGSAVMLLHKVDLFEVLPERANNPMFRSMIGRYLDSLSWQDAETYERMRRYFKRLGLYNEEKLTLVQPKVDGDDPA